jgi:hypothetical protein
MARHHSLRQLRLAFSSPEYHHILQQGGASLARLPELWGKAMHALSDAMQVGGEGRGRGGWLLGLACLAAMMLEATWSRRCRWLVVEQMASSYGCWALQAFQCTGMQPRSLLQ